MTPTYESQVDGTPWQKYKRFTKMFTDSRV